MQKIMTETMSMVKFSSRVLRMFIITINNKNEKFDCDKCLGLSVPNYGPGDRQFYI